MAGLSAEDDCFKQTFKYYKRKKPAPDLSDVIDFTTHHKNHVPVIELPICEPIINPVKGLQPIEQWKIYGLPEMPGFYFIPNPFRHGYQQYWMKRCLQDYPCKPNLTNLDAHMNLTTSDNIWHLSRSQTDPQKSLIKKLRWVTLGYHHDWNTKEYSGSNVTPFPADLAYLSRYLATVVGHGDYRPQAAIVNFYHMDSTLSAHTDHSELDHEAPLISVSFGQTAIFLVGGKTKDVKPVAMYLRSGDVTIMSGPCRLAYHAIPRIIAENLPDPELSPPAEPLPETDPPDVPNICPSNRDQGARNNVSEKSGPGEDCSPDLTSCFCRCHGDDRCADLAPGGVGCHRDRSGCVDTSPVSGATERVGGSPLLTELPSAAVALCPQSSDPDTQPDTSMFPGQCCCVCDINTVIGRTVSTVEWSPFMEYTKTGRINMNVRQVLKPGQTFPERPS